VPAHIGTSCQPKAGGSTKYTQKIMTSAEVPRNTSV
jgi:hypothetical protein